MKILLGLGNPGRKYARNRHNVGFMCVDRLAERIGARFEARDDDSVEGVGQLAGEPVVIVKPRTYMNRSGRAAQRALRRHGRMGESVGLLVAFHDDVDLPLGRLRVKDGGGHGGHNGLRSLMQVLGSGDFPRIRLGVGRPDDAGEDLADWVLANFTRDEMSIVDDLTSKGADAAETVVTAGVREAMNRFNGA